MVVDLGRLSVRERHRVQTITFLDVAEFVSHPVIGHAYSYAAISGKRRSISRGSLRVNEEKSQRQINQDFATLLHYNKVANKRG